MIVMEKASTKKAMAPTENISTINMLDIREIESLSKVPKIGLKG